MKAQVEAAQHNMPQVQRCTPASIKPAYQLLEDSIAIAVYSYVAT